ncbi:MAG: DUF3791 domain-containing protein [Paludibacteraceae bacterium]|nr:DUF3791 domain-containing protein [Paludibacteraceae bacterium]MBR5696698.1 DUF3791 domain-containing protein [Paludibacteraceae bacterium]MCR5498075.1 DUF3791 domain-containing protein [Paludibacteraceae bacterium]
MDKSKIAYIVALIRDFAVAHNLTEQVAFRYLKRYGGDTYMDEFYDVLHTFSFADSVYYLTAYCKKQGGTL